MWPIPKIPSVFISFLHLCSHSLLHASIKNYLMYKQRCNKISVTWMVNIHSWSTSPLLLSLKIEISREGKKKKKKPKTQTTSIQTWQERQEIIPWITWQSQHLFQLQDFHPPMCSTATLPSYSSPQYQPYRYYSSSAVHLVSNTLYIHFSKMLFCWYWRCELAHRWWVFAVWKIFGKTVPRRLKQQLQMHLGFSSGIFCNTHTQKKKGCCLRR